LCAHFEGGTALNPLYRNIFVWVAIAIILIFVFDYVSSNRDKDVDEVPFSEFMRKVEQNLIREISIKTGEQVLHGQTTNGQDFKTYIIVQSFDSAFLENLRSKGLKVQVEPDNVNPWYGYLLTWLPMIFFYRHLDFLYAPNADGRQ
jgi:ATP-dependent Zn protease